MNMIGGEHTCGKGRDRSRFLVATQRRGSAATFIGAKEEVQVIRKLIVLYHQSPTRIDTGRERRNKGGAGTASGGKEEGIIGGGPSWR